MDFFKKAPNWLMEAAPGGVKPYLEGTTWYVIEGVVGLIALLVLLLLLRGVVRLFSGGSSTKRKRTASQLEEHLEEYPPPKPSTGDRQLRVEGVPCRLRLLAIAPAGTASEIDEDAIPDILEKIVTGLGNVFEADKPRMRIWPVQISYQGFATHFHRNTIIPEEEGEPTPWIVVAGRVKLAGKQQFMLGMALVAMKPTTVGRRTYDSHDWATAVKVRIRE